jgi:para-nitrobenzyl esterase
MRNWIKKEIVGLIIAASLGVISQARAQDPTVVKIDSGTVQGAIAGDVIAWKGIPYAAPPVGQLRWRNPQPVVAWTGIKDTKTFCPACMQTDDVPKSENCLYLNVFRPAKTSAASLPVMVWFHGGVMLHGSSTIYPGDALAAQGVIVVTVNFRLGRLGYFAHPALAAEAPDDVRGNYGFMDQRAALQWIQKNIAAFGGDPQQVTIFGESAGGGSVLAHLVSPMSRGLFHRAILQSHASPTSRAGVAPSSDLQKAERIAVEWSRSVGVTSDGAAALKELRDLPAAKLIEGASAKEGIAALSTGTSLPGMAWAIIDGRFLIETAEATLAASGQNKVPVIVGANDRDIGLDMAKSKDELFAVFGPDAARARELYDPRGDQTLEELIIQVYMDKTMTEPAQHLANELARGDQPVWLYRFAYVSQAQRGQLMGTMHAYEIPFTLNIPGALVGADKVTPTDKVMGDLTSAYWAQFGKTGDPNGGARPVWPRYDPAVDRIMHFTGSGVIVGTDPLKARLDLWERVWSRKD